LPDVRFPKKRTRSGGTGIATPHLPFGKRVKVDKPRIVVLESAIELPAAMKLHQGSHSPCV